MDAPVDTPLNETGGEGARNRRRGKKQRVDLHMFNYMKFDHSIRDGKVHVRDHHLDDKHEELTTKEVLHHILHSKPVHLTVIGLVIVDLLLVVFEILLDLNVIHVEHHTNPLPHILHGFSIGILIFFFSEICIKIYADTSHFFTHKIEMIDGFVVVVSLTMDLVTAFLPSDELLAAVGVLILFRLWRIVRVVNGIMVAVKEQADHDLEVKTHEAEVLAKKVEEQSHELVVQREAISELVAILNEHGVKVGGKLLEDLGCNNAAA